MHLLIKTREILLKYLFNKMHLLIKTREITQLLLSYWHIVIDNKNFNLSYVKQIESIAIYKDLVVTWLADGLVTHASVIRFLNIFSNISNKYFKLSCMWWEFHSAWHGSTNHHGKILYDGMLSGTKVGGLLRWSILGRY